MLALLEDTIYPIRLKDLSQLAEDDRSENRKIAKSTRNDGICSRTSELFQKVRGSLSYFFFSFLLACLTHWNLLACTYLACTGIYWRARTWRVLESIGVHVLGVHYNLCINSLESIGVHVLGVHYTRACTVVRAESAPPGWYSDQDLCDVRGVPEVRTLHKGCSRSQDTSQVVSQKSAHFTRGVPEARTPHKGCPRSPHTSQGVSQKPGHIIRGVPGVRTLHKRCPRSPQTS